MSEVLAIYNRDNNVSGTIATGSFVPEYGSTVSWEIEDNTFYTADYHHKSLSHLNGTNLKFNLKFSNKTETEAKSLLHRFEEVGRSESGILDFNTTGVQGVEIAFPTGDIYKNISDLYIQDYDFKFHDGLFDIDLNLMKDGYSYIFDWDSSAYLNTGNFQTGWIGANAYKKFDIVLFTGYNTGSATNFDTQVNLIDKFYYCNQDHTSSQTNSPTGVSTLWSRSFFFDVDDNISIKTDKKPSELVKLNKTFTNFSKSDANVGLIENLNLTLNNRTDKETRAIIHFLEKHEGYKPFELNLPQLYNQRKFFICKSFSHKFVYKDCNDINLTVGEVIHFKKETILDSFRHDN